MNASTKKWLSAGIAALAIAALVVQTRGLPGSAPAGQVNAAEQPANGKNVITVTGQGEMTVKPDVAYVNVGIRTEAATAGEAQKANAEAFAKLRNVLFDDYKLDPKDVQTSDFRVQPEYTYTDRDPKIKGYSATQMVQVTYRDLDRLGAFLDAVTGAGANRIEGVRFSTEKAKEYELQVIEKAMDNAKAKAETIAKYAGKSLKGIVGVSHGGGAAVPAVYRDFAVAEAKLVAADAAMPTPISAGELKITTSVTVQYEF